MKEVTEVGEQLQDYEETLKNKSHDQAIKNIAKNKEQIAAQKHKQVEYEKRIRQIEASNTWKIGNIFRPIRQFWQKLFNRAAIDAEKIAQLEAKIIEQEKQIENLHDELTPLRLLDQQITT